MKCFNRNVDMNHRSQELIVNTFALREKEFPDRFVTASKLCKWKAKAMSSNPCKSAYRSERCPPLSDSDTEDEADGKEVAQNDSDEKSTTTISSHECFAIHRGPDDKTRVDSIVRLETDVDKLQQQIDSINQEKLRVQDEIREKRKKLIDAIMKVVEFEKSIQAVEGCIADKLHHFQARIIDLERKRQEIFLTSGDATIRDLLENEINEVKDEHEQQVKSNDAERDQITQQAQLFAASLGNVIDEYQNYHNEMMTEMQPQPEVEAKLEEDFRDNMKQLNQLINRPAQFCKNSKGERFYLNRETEKIFKLDTHSSEYKLSVGGEKIRSGFPLSVNDNGEFYIDVRGREIYTKFFFEDDFGRFYIDTHGERNYKADPEASEYKLINGNWVRIKDGTYEKDERGMRVKPEPEVVMNVEDLNTTSEKRTSQSHDDDLNYIRETVGPAIRKGLAAVALHQPDDPVSYFANFLLHYRYNQHMFEMRDKDLKKYLELRETMKLEE